MSANNKLKIWKVKDVWCVHNVDVDTGSGLEVTEAPSLEIAIERANMYMGQNEVEYGLDITI